MENEILASLCGSSATFQDRKKSPTLACTHYAAYLDLGKKWINKPLCVRSAGYLARVATCTYYKSIFND